MTKAIIKVLSGLPGEWRKETIYPGINYTLGRAEDRKEEKNFLHHANRSTSRTHGSLTLSEEGLLHYRDLGSTHGSAVQRTNLLGFENSGDSLAVIVPEEGLYLAEGDRITVPNGRFPKEDRVYIEPISKRKFTLTSGYGGFDVIVENIGE